MKLAMVVIQKIIFIFNITDIFYFCAIMKFANYTTFIGKPWTA